MKATFHHRSTCRLCDSSRVERVVQLAPIPLAEKYLDPGEAQSADDPFYPVDLYSCLDCGHVQILDVIDPDTLWDDYTYHSGQTRGIVEHFAQVAEQTVQRYRPAPGSLAVDIGSNDGSLLREFARRGMRVVGVDPAREIARRATENGIETIPEFMTPELARRIRQQQGPAAIVTAFNSFAHADDMQGIAESVRELLAPDGVFLFEVQYLMDIVDGMLLGTIFHEHLCHHSLQPLIGFLARHGMQVIDVERVSIQKGSIIGTVQLSGGARTVSPAVGELLQLEEQRQLNDPGTMRAFAARLRQLRERAQQLVADWQSRGCTVAGYGAARSGPTLIAQLGLESVIQYVLDDHPQKVHKLTPGHHLPVLPTAELYVRRPDYVVLLAWIHAKKIIANNQRYLDEGGRFVVCCPEVEVIG